MKNVFRANFSKLVELVERVFNEDRYANKELEKLFRTNKKLGARDRHFLAENIYELVRWWRKALHAANFHESIYQRKVRLTPQEIEHLLMGWLTVRSYDLTHFLNTPESVSFVKRFSKRWYDKRLPDILQESYSDFFWQCLQEQFGKGHLEVAKALNTPALIYLRANLQRTSVAELRELLAKEDIHCEVVDKDLGTLCLHERKNVFRTPPFKEGLFEVQDWGSQHISPFLEVEPGMRVVDACAGAGGKTLHLAGLMKNKGKLVALDIHQWKLTEAKLRARRNQLSIVETRVIDSTKVIKRLKEKADRLLLDVPCTGSGVIRRNPDTKWKIDEENMGELLKLQAEILSKYSQMVKPGGKMVYATCSLFDKENKDQVQNFLSQSKGWTLEEEFTIVPTRKDCDGFYAARLKRD